MRLKPLLTVGILFGITFQAVASNIRKAPYPTPPTPTPTASVSAPSKNAPVARDVVPPPTATPNVVPTPVLPGVTVWPSLSKGGHCILFKAPSDPGSPIQLSIQNSLGQVVFTTSFSGKSRSGGYVWRLQDLSGSPVAGGDYVYILRFTKDGQPVTSTGKVTVLH